MPRWLRMLKIILNIFQRRLNSEANLWVSSRFAHPAGGEDELYRGSSLSRQRPLDFDKRVNIDAGSLQWWTTTRRPQRRPDSRRRRRTRPAATVGRRAGLSRRPIHRAQLTCTARAPPPQQQPQPRIPQSQATSRPQLARSPPRPRSPRSPYPVPRSTTVL